MQLYGLWYALLALLCHAPCQVPDVKLSLILPMLHVGSQLTSGWQTSWRLHSYWVMALGLKSLSIPAGTLVEIPPGPLQGLVKHPVLGPTLGSLFRESVKKLPNYLLSNKSPDCATFSETTFWKSCATVLFGVCCMGVGVGGLRTVVEGS